MVLIKSVLVVPRLLVRQVGVEAQVVVFELQVRQFAKVEDFKFVEFVDEQVVEGKQNLLFSPLEWRRIDNFGLCFESKD